MSCGTRCSFLLLWQDINFLRQEINFRWQEIDFLWQELNFLWQEINFLWQEINFLSQEEQRTPHVTGKIVIGRGETHQSLINLIVSTRMWWLSLYGLKKHPGLIFIAHCPNGTGAISKLIPWLCIFDESCHWLQFRVDYCVDDGAIFPLFRAKLFTGKLGSHEISNILPPWGTVLSCDLIHV